MSTTYERTVNVPFESRLIFVLRQTTTNDRTIDVPKDVTVAATGCIIYNASQSNKAICVIDFGGTVSATAGDLTIEFPAADASNAVIRIA